MHFHDTSPCFAKFQENLLQVLGSRIVVEKYPDFYDRSRARFKRTKDTDFASPDATDLEQKDFGKRVDAQANYRGVAKVR